MNSAWIATYLVNKEGVLGKEIVLSVLWYCCWLQQSCKSSHVTMSTSQENVVTTGTNVERLGTDAAAYWKDNSWLMIAPSAEA
ncbi:hypothetical protein JTE90_022604 [Oedothorax gibbosus]|uniref:Uncharacterized protein n=1 Tax=Oedothorax gibbosus TaxID=931172 RepID=A0AAV6TU34_9ARAC|nr:hypothetical protein JTE90_022604 [Oedothorax gibbosus]